MDGSEVRSWARDERQEEIGRETLRPRHLPPLVHDSIFAVISLFQVGFGKEMVHTAISAREHGIPSALP